MRALAIGALTTLFAAMFAGFVWLMMDSSREDDDEWRE